MRPEMCETKHPKPLAVDIGGKALAPKAMLVEAVRFLPPHNCNEISWFVGTDEVPCDGTCVPGQTFRIPEHLAPVSVDHDLLAQPGDWIVRHDSGPGDGVYTVRTHAEILHDWVEIAPWET